MSTAQEQFIEDFFLVADNTREIYDELMGIVGEYPRPTHELAERLETWWDWKIEKITRTMKDNPGLFINQMMRNWGTDTWYKIATQLEETYKQTSRAVNA